MRSQPNYFDVALFLFHPKKWLKKMLIQLNVGSKKLRLKKSFGPQKFWLQKNLIQTNFAQKVSSKLGQ